MEVLLDYMSKLMQQTIEIWTSRGKNYNENKCDRMNLRENDKYLR